MISMVMVAVGVYARLLKHAEAAMACLAVDPAILLIMVGVLTFLITFCGCVGSLRENICLLQMFSVCLTVIFLLQLAAGVLGFVFSDKVPNPEGGMRNPNLVGVMGDPTQFSLSSWDWLLAWGHRGRGHPTKARPELLVTTRPPPKNRDPSVSCPLSQAVINTMCGHGMQARGYLEASAFIHTNGCIDKLVNWTHSNLFLLGGITLGLALPQLVGIVLAQLLINQIRDQIKLQLYNQQHRADPWY
ncbi:TSN33 protein, partial [Poecile atricapillus]|nr:TSN33 protein [Poecile atricapillus]